MLHITNGDSAATSLRAIGLDGEVLPWRDPMHHGPFCHTGELSACSRLRSRYLTGQDDAFQERDAHVLAGGKHEEIVLWFEHDLLDQLQLLQLLDVFGRAVHRPRRISLIAIGRFPGIEPFRGLGQLNARQLASLYPQRQAVEERHFARGRRVWAQFVAKDPTALVQSAFDGDETLAFLQAALQRHLQEFPWRHDGLTRSERQLLRLIQQGVTRPQQLFVDNMALEQALYIGDLYTFRCLDELASEPSPLIAWQGDRHKDLAGCRVSLTAAGAAVLAGEAPPATQRRRDQWLGGVHLLTGENEWFWDEATRTLIP